MIIIGVAIEETGARCPEGQREMSQQPATVALTFATLPIRPNAPIIDATVPSSPSSGPIRTTIVEIDASRFSMAPITSVWNSITRTCLTFASPLVRFFNATATSCASAVCQ